MGRTRDTIGLERQGTTPRASRRRAFTTVSALFLVALALLTVFVMASVSMTQIRLSARGQARAIGLTLAEAGVDDTVDRLRLDPGYSRGVFTREQLFEDPDTRQRSLGWYRVKVEDVTGDPTARKVTSAALKPDGETPLGVQMVAVVRLDSFQLGSKYAVLANGPVKITGDANVATRPAGLHSADVRSNSDVTVSGNAAVDGGLYASGAVTGEGYYPSKGGLPRVYFPSVATTDGWRTDWVTTSRSTNQILQGANVGSSGAGGGGGTGAGGGNGGGNNGNGGNNAANGVGGPTVITAPAFIQGDVRLNGSEQVELRPAADPKRSVVYVDGAWEMNASSRLTNKGVTLVVNRTFRQNGQSLYTVEQPAVDTPTLVVFGTGFGAADDVIRINGGGTAFNQGVVYAVNGSIVVNGTAAFVGSLVAGGAGGGITVNGTFNQFYPNAQSSPVSFFSAARVESVVEM
jgi:hypothetical protein